MGDKCESHDECFKRLYEKVEALSSDIRENFLELKELYHKKELRLAVLENRLEQCEQKISIRGTDWNAFFVDILSGVIKIGIPAIGGMIWWSLQNGYGK